jgi:poly(A) polymerase
VRDLLFGNRPKDFDLVTDAEPNAIRKLFRNSRIIGKRFRLVHVFFRDEKIIEVCTFRSIDAGTFNNVYGCIEEDARRRDFSINALYYDPVADIVVDFVGGFKDLKSRRLKPVIPLDNIFTEDPVRMIRAVKYAQSTGCRMGFFLKRKIKAQARLLLDVSASRISEEAFKIMQCGRAAPLIKELLSFNLLTAIFPTIDGLLRDPAQLQFRKRFFASLETLDTAVQQHHEGRRSIQLSFFIADYLFFVSPWAKDKRPAFSMVYQGIKEFLKPVTPPNVEVERALVYLMRKRALYFRDGRMPTIEVGRNFDETNGEYSLELAALRDERENKRRRPRNRHAETEKKDLHTTKSHNNPQRHGGVTRNGASDITAPSTPIAEIKPKRKRRRPSKKKNPNLIPNPGE